MKASSRPKRHKTPRVLQEGAGELANGFISVGGASTPEIRTATHG